MSPVIKTFTKHQTNEAKVKKATVSLRTIRAQLKLPERGGSQDLDPEDGQQPELEKSVGVTAQEAGGGQCEGKRDHHILIHTQNYVK
jgi:hypothetical protein